MKRTRRPDLKAAQVTWEDATALNGWLPAVEEVLELLRQHENLTVSVGLVLQDSKDYVILAQTYNDEGVADVLKIPKAIVKKVTYL